VAAPLTHAGTWTETGDAGDTLFNAQLALGSGPLTQITGTLPMATNLDAFRIRITDVGNLMA
jgi:hypothetical protein